jgi:hypothetical protein
VNKFVNVLSAAVVACSFGSATVAQDAAPVPFINILTLAEPNDLFHSEAGFYFVLDGEQNLAWMMDEDGYFQGLVAFNRYDGIVHVVRDGRIEFEFDETAPVSPTLFEGFKEEYLPATRAQFQQIAGSRMVAPLGDFLPEGTLFTSLFTVETPDGEYHVWWPDYQARGVFVENLETRDMRFVFMKDLAPVLNLPMETPDE